jgi:hypothetical protein
MNITLKLMMHVIVFFFPLKRKIVGITIAAAEVYADLIGADQLRIMRPVNDVVVRYYQEFGFTLRKGKASNIPTYLWKNL